MRKPDHDPTVRVASPADDSAISKLLPPSSQESKVLTSLRRSENLSLSLISTFGRPGKEEVIAVLAFSPIALLPTSTTFDKNPVTPTPGWFALGPIYVSKPYRRKGVGTGLILKGLEMVEKEHGGKGVVVVGFPSFYRRLGFVHDERITFDGAPEQYFMVKRLPVGREEEGRVKDFGAFSR